MKPFTEDTRVSQPDVPMRLRDNQWCFVCGRDNPIGLKLEFRMPSENEIESEFVSKPQFQGFEGLLHGGIIMLLLDEVMVNLAWKKGLNAVSADLHVRLKKAVRTGEKVVLKGRIVGEDKRIVRTEAVALSPEGQLLAEARGTCLKIKDAGEDKKMDENNRAQ